MRYIGLKSINDGAGIMSSDKKSNDTLISDGEEGRRSLLKKLSAGGSGLAIAKWTAPVLSAIAIPAHAQTSLGVAFTAVVTFEFPLS
ncbi:MAG: hypothetical protein ACI9XU_001901 [Arenicella sp.]